MSKIDKKVLEDIEILSKTMDKNQLSEIKYTDKDISYELKKATKHQYLNVSKDVVGEKKNSVGKKISPIETALKSPLVGTAYLSPEPGAKKFIEEGQTVKIGQVLLIIEAMKTMNEITADKNGVIKKIFIKNESPVEFGEALVLIE
jgi:acetyl-CoA carboxylase biotin carboxyl carrier protein|tara:strand:+ start:1051 stop:1488 length:438 start_codon:yes stop_codon:yes gene_type:complete